MSGCCCEKCHDSEYLQRAAEANGDGVPFDVLGYPAITLQVFGDLSGGSDVEVQFLSGTDWLPIAVENVSTGVVTDTGIITAEGTYRVNTTGLQKIKAEVTGYAGTDSINVVATAVCEAMASGGGGGGEITGEVSITSGPTGASALQVQGTAADNAAAVGNPVQVGGVAVDTATYAPAYTANDAAKLAIDKDSGALLVNPGLPSSTLVSTVAYAASLVIKNAPGTLISLEGYNSGAAQFIQVHNAAALPADTAVPTYVFAVPATSNFSLSIPLSGAPFTVGIVVCNSSTGPTKTIGGADCWFTAVRI